MLDPTTRFGAKEVQARAIAALSTALGELGLEFSSAGGVIGGDELVMKIRVRPGGDAGLAKRRGNFAANASYFGLAPEDFGRKIRLSGHLFEVVGLDISRPKNCVQIKRLSDGMAMICPPQSVISGRVPA